MELVKELKLNTKEDDLIEDFYELTQGIMLALSESDEDTLLEQKPILNAIAKNIEQIKVMCYCKEDTNQKD